MLKVKCWSDLVEDSEEWNGHVDGKGNADKFSYGTENSPGTWTKGHPGDMMAKNLTFFFCLSPETEDG